MPCGIAADARASPQVARHLFSARPIFSGLHAVLVKGTNRVQRVRSPPMKIKRRQFLQSSVTASASAVLAGTASSTARAAAAASGRDYYDLRSYRLKPGTSHANLDRYLEKALLPALGARGVRNVGV